MIIEQPLLMSYLFTVCQEAIWEAFRVFFDRVPSSEEYMSWVYTCQHENLCMDDLARNFSSSPEHLDMVARVSSIITKPIISLRGCVFSSFVCMYHVFAKIPGFKEIQVLGFRIIVISNEQELFLCSSGQRTSLCVMQSYLTVILNSVTSQREGDSVSSENIPTEGDSVSSESMPTEGDSVSSESTLTVGESGSGLSSDADRGLYEWTSAPAMRQASTPLMAAVERSKDLVVFFRLRVSNMMFTDNLFNKESAEYKSLENTFLELLLPYLETNLTGFKALEILSFQNGSVIVNSKMKLNKAVPYNVTEAVHCVLEDFCNSASSQLDIQVDSRSLEVEPADAPDLCQSVTCSEFSRCMINGWSGEAECVCDPGYSAVEGQPCQSLCTLEPDFCLNGGLCQNIPGHGATCRYNSHQHKSKRYNEMFINILRNNTHSHWYGRTQNSQNCKL
uniref:Interphotoreceptor matrix proteoglycan 1 n=1 Tax=Periophthalmus magnuspinnatus TaxID=409849 RepID=A0A3B4AP59_9GOBI